MHPMSMADLKRLCVDAFPGSPTRTRIWNGFAFVIDKLLQCEVEADVWLNGSFMTERTDPQDADLVLCIRAEVYENGTTQTKEAIDWINDNLRGAHLCDSYRFFVYPANDPLYGDGESDRSYWLNQFGKTYAKDQPKGIAVIELRPRRKQTVR